MLDDFVLLLFAIGAGLGCVAVAVVAWRLRAAPALSYRIRSVAAQPILAARQGNSSAVPARPVPRTLAARLLHRASNRLQRLRLSAGLKGGLSRFVAATLLLSLLAGVIASYLDAPLPVAALAAAVGVVMPFLNLQRLAARRHLVIVAQLPDALDAISRAMQAGHSLVGALRGSAADGPAPLALELRVIVDEIAFGLSEEAALKNLALRVALPDLRYFVSAVSIQREAGGNLVQLLTSLSKQMRERAAQRGAIRVLSAEGRISASILGSMPFVIVAAVGFLNPKFMSPLWSDPVGISMVKFALLGIALGIVWMWQIVRVRI